MRRSFLMALLSILLIVACNTETRKPAESAADRPPVDPMELTGEEVEIEARVSRAFNHQFFTVSDPAVLEGPSLTVDEMLVIFPVDMDLESQKPEAAVEVTGEIVPFAPDALRDERGIEIPDQVLEGFPAGTPVIVASVIWEKPEQFVTPE